MYFVHMNKQEEDRRVERFPRNALIYEENPVDDKKRNRSTVSNVTDIYMVHVHSFQRTPPPHPFKCQGPCNSTPRVSIVINIVLTFLSLVNNDK